MLLARTPGIAWGAQVSHGILVPPMLSIKTSSHRPELLGALLAALFLNTAKRCWRQIFEFQKVATLVTDSPNTQLYLACWLDPKQMQFDGFKPSRRHDCRSGVDCRSSTTRPAAYWRIAMQSRYFATSRVLAHCDARESAVLVVEERCGSWRIGWRQDARRLEGKGTEGSAWRRRTRSKH